MTAASPAPAQTALKDHLADLWNLLQGEHLKARRTRLYLTAVLVPLVFSAFILFILAVMPAQEAGKVTSDRGLWMMIRMLGHALFAAFGLPILIAMLASQLHGLEHTRNTWKVLLSLPVGRGSVYWSKALFLVWLVTLAQVVFLLALVTSYGLALLINSNLPRLAVPVWLLLQTFAGVWLAALGMVGIHHLLALRFKGTGLNIGVALVGMICGSVLVSMWQHGINFPYSFTYKAGEMLITDPSTFWVRPVWLGQVVGLTVLLLGDWLMRRRMPS